MTDEIELGPEAGRAEDLSAEAVAQRIAAARERDEAAAAAPEDEDEGEDEESAAERALYNRAAELFAETLATWTEILGPEASVQPCPLCEGKGFASEQLPDAPWAERCPDCDGYGRVRSGARTGTVVVIDCRSCNGRGYRDVATMQPGAVPLAVPPPVILAPPAAGY